MLQNFCCRQFCQAIFWGQPKYYHIYHLFSSLTPLLTDKPISNSPVWWSLLLVCLFGYLFNLWIILSYLFFFYIGITNISTMSFFHYLAITTKHEGENLLVHGSPLGSTEKLHVQWKPAPKSCLICKPWLVFLFRCDMPPKWLENQNEISPEMKLAYPQAGEWKAGGDVPQ